MKDKDFEDLGFLLKVDGCIKIFEKEEKVKKYSPSELCSFTIIYKPRTNHIAVFYEMMCKNPDKGEGIFYGYIETKRELKVLLKQLGI